MCVLPDSAVVASAPDLCHGKKSTAMTGSRSRAQSTSPVTASTSPGSECGGEDVETEAHNQPASPHLLLSMAIGLTGSSAVDDISDSTSSEEEPNVSSSPQQPLPVPSTTPERVRARPVIRSAPPASHVRKGVQANYSSLPWYHGSIDRERAAALVMGSSSGSFLVRQSQSLSGEYVLSVNWHGTPRHMRVAHNLNEVNISGVSFPDMASLLAYFRRTPFPSADNMSGELPLLLTVCVAVRHRNATASHVRKTSFPIFLTFTFSISAFSLPLSLLSLVSLRFIFLIQIMHKLMCKPPCG